MTTLDGRSGMKQNTSKRRFITALTIVFGLIGTFGGLYLFFWADHQVSLYNQGLAQYRTLEFKESAKSFERSIVAYEHAGDRQWLERFVYPAPDREVAALAALHLGNALLRQKDVPRAIKAFQKSIRLNPGTGYSSLPGYPVELSPKDLTRLTRQAEIAKYNLELLLRNSPEENEKKGPGNKLEAEDKEEEEDQIPQIAPGSQPGKGGADDLI